MKLIFLQLISLGLQDYSDIGGSMVGYTLFHFSRFSPVQFPNQLWDFLQRATGFLGLIPHEDSGKPGQEFWLCNSHNEGQIGRTLAHAPMNRPPASAAESLLPVSPPSPTRSGTGY